MNYQETLDYLYALLPVFQRVGKAAYKATLDNTRALDEYFQSPHKKFPSVHIAGTNGKGSVSHMLASVYQTAGYKTGLYTSPHYIDFRERIKINGRCIEQTAVIDFVEQHKGFIEDLKPSFFELTVALAFYFFAENNVDIAIIEVGMGGRLDSTNIITPLVSVITNIGYDHQQFLGSTLPEIAREKAGIIKPGIALVIGETQDEVKEVFLDRAALMNAPTVFADRVYDIPLALTTLQQHQRLSVMKDGKTVYLEMETDLLADYQLKNIKTVLSTLDIVRKTFKVTESSVLKGLKAVAKNTGLMGRFMYLGYNPRIICDAGHNKEGITAVLCQLANIPYKRLFIVLGFVNDKNLEEIIALFPKTAQYIFTRADIPRALSVEDLSQQGKNAGLIGVSLPTVCESVMKAEHDATPEDLIFIGGSTFVVAEAIKCKKMQKSVCI